ncbi:MAG: division/cell wall cluster transcriptional repressor MraZ [Terracidiphilus sp.]
MADSPETTPAGEPETSMEAAGGAVGAWDDLQVGFIGNPKAKLDDRGRLKLPAEFKSFIEKKYGKDFNAFYIVSREGKDAEIYAMPEWQQHMAKVFKMPKSSPARQKLLERYTLFGDRADMDPQGRLLFPEELRNAGMVNVEVKVSGEGTLLRVKSLNNLRESVKTNPFTAQETDSLTEYDV